MEGGVEARDRRQLGQPLADRVSAASDLRLVQRGEVDERAQLALDVGVDPHRLAEALAAVDDPMPDRVGVAEPRVERVAQLGADRPARAARPARAPRIVASSPSSSVSLRLLEPALTTSTRTRSALS